MKDEFAFPNYPLALRAPQLPREPAALNLLSHIPYTCLLVDLSQACQSCTLLGPPAIKSPTPKSLSRLSVIQLLLAFEVDRGQQQRDDDGAPETISKAGHQQR